MYTLSIHFCPFKNDSENISKYFQKTGFLIFCLKLRFCNFLNIFMFFSSIYQGSHCSYFSALHASLLPLNSISLLDLTKFRPKITIKKVYMPKSCLWTVVEILAKNQYAFHLIENFSLSTQFYKAEFF